MEVDCQSLAQYRQLASTLKMTINKAKSTLEFPEFAEDQGIENTTDLVSEDVATQINELKELDKSINTPCPVVDNNNPNSVNESKELETDLATPSPATNKDSKLRTSKVLGRKKLTIELPEQCIVDKIDMDKLPSVDQENKSMVLPMRKLTFRERLDGWTVERRQRRNKSHDWFYFHPSARRMFRSVDEVIEFILYEVYPSNKKKEKRLMVIEDSGKNMTEEAPTMKRACMSTSINDCINEQGISRDIMIEFYKDAHNNMINFGSKNIGENNYTESESQRSMLKPQQSILQMSSGELEQTRSKEAVTDYQRPILQSGQDYISRILSFRSMSPAKLPLEGQVAHNAYDQALEVVPISIYRPIKLDADVTRTTYIQSMSTPKLPLGVQVAANAYSQALEVVPISTYKQIELDADVTTTLATGNHMTRKAPSIERTCMSTFSGDRSEQESERKIEETLFQGLLP